MRKDVKLAFAVGGILISVLIVYVLVVPGGEKRAADKQTVTLDQGDKPAPADKTAPAPEPEKLADASKPAETATADQKPAEAAPTTKPTDPFASAGDKDKEDAWMLALNRGSVPMMTSAPPMPQPGQTRAARSQASLAGATQTPAEQSSTPSTRPVSLEPVQPTPGMRTHVVAKGETIAKIAEAVYGSQNYWPHIIRANPGLVAEKLRPGMTINLPPESDVKGGATSTNTTVADAAAPKPDTTSPQVDKNTQYE